MRYFYILLLTSFFCLPGIGQVDTIKYGLKGKVIRAFEKSPTTPGTYYAGLKGNTLGTGFVYKSEDHGKTWSVLNDGKPIDPYVADIQAIAESRSSDKTLFAGTWKNGMIISKDGGVTWSKDVHFPSSDIRSIKTGIQHPELVYASTSSFGVVKSIDGGNTWSRNTPEVVDSTFQFAWSIEIAPHDDNIIFAQTFSDGVWQSIDQGASWKKILDTDGKVCWDMKVSDDSADIWVATSARGDSTSAIYHSQDMGSTWTELQNVPQIGLNQIDVIRSNESHNLIVGSWQDGVYIMKDGAWLKEESVGFSRIAHIISDKDQALIGSWGNGIYHIR